MEDTLFLSIRPVFAEAILAGAKRVELRRTRPRVETGTSVLIYASFPNCALLGGATVQRLQAGAPSTLWNQVRDDDGVTRRVFRQYFDGAPSGYGIWLHKVWRLAEPIELETLRQRLPGFSPPQSFRYLTPSSVRSLQLKTDSRRRRSMAVTCLENS